MKRILFTALPAGLALEAEALLKRELIKLVEEYAGSLETFSDIENLSLYHHLSIYGDDADELLSIR